MAYGSEIPLIGRELFKLHFVENNGMAFGFSFGGEYGKLALTLFRIIAVCGLGYFIKLLIDRQSNLGLVISFSLILAGALGNIIDSTFYGLIFSKAYHSGIAEFMPEGGGYAGLFHGKVVDMLHIVLLKGSYPEWFPFIGNKPFLFFKPVFNIADVAITAGVLNIILFQRAFFKSDEEVANSEDSNEEQTPPIDSEGESEAVDEQPNSLASDSSEMEE